MRQPKHPSRQPVIHRLRRAAGQLNSIIEMLENKRPTHEVAQQLCSVEMGLNGAKRTLIHDQMLHHVESRDMSGGSIRQLCDLTKFL